MKWKDLIIYVCSLILICYQLHNVSVLQCKEKPPLNVVGDVSGRIAIIVVRLWGFEEMVYYPEIGGQLWDLAFDKTLCLCIK